MRLHAKNLQPRWRDGAIVWQRFCEEFLILGMDVRRRFVSVCALLSWICIVFCFYCSCILPFAGSAVPSGPCIDMWRSCGFLGALLRALGGLPGGPGRFPPCRLGAIRCTLSSTT